jgi:hypothetical protein
MRAQLGARRLARRLPIHLLSQSATHSRSLMLIQCVNTESMRERLGRVVPA